MLNYIALLRKEPNSDYSVEFPDFPGCITAGRTLDEAKDMAQEALQLHLDGMQEDGESLPFPSTLEEIMSHQENQGTAAFIVPYRGRLKTVRVNITMDTEALKMVDEDSRKMGMSRSGYLSYLAHKSHDNHI